MGGFVRGCGAPRRAAPARRCGEGGASRHPGGSAPVQSLARHGGGTELLAELGSGSPRRSWTMLPGDWPSEIAAAAAATVSAGRGVVVLAPDARDVARLDAALGAVLGAGRHVALTADLGPAERYRRFLAVSRGDIRAVVGTRAAIWAPVRDLGLIIVWDDGDDLFAEPRAPYPMPATSPWFAPTGRRCRTVARGPP